MFSVEWDEEDLNELNISLDMLMPPELAREELPRLAYIVMAETRRYPPPKQGSTYERTNKLFEGWKREVLDHLKVKVYNPVEYGTYVQGRWQVDMHKTTGWRNLYEMAEKQVERFIYHLEMRINKIWNTPFK